MLNKIDWNYPDIPYVYDIHQKFDMICSKKEVHAIVYIHGGGYFDINENIKIAACICLAGPTNSAGSRQA